MDNKKPIEKEIPERRNMMEEMALHQEKLYSLRLSHGIIPECLYENFPREQYAIQNSKGLKN